MNVLMCVGIGVILTYVLWSIKTFGIPPSISDTHYLWYEKGGLGKHIFTIVLFAVSFLCLPYIIESSKEGTEFLGFISFGALAFVGAACEFKERLTKTVHYASAIVWALFGIIWCVINVGPICLVSAVPGVIEALGDRKNKTFWLEVACIFVIITTLLLNMP